jgi:CRISPR-associated endonuclease/helicase Cas3
MGTTPEFDALNKDLFESAHPIVSSASFKARYAHKEACEQYASILEAHHGFSGETAVLDDTHHRYGGPAWAALRAKLIDKLIKEFGEPYLTPLSGYDAELVAGFLVLCDWIGSDEHFFDQSKKVKNIHGAAIKAIRSLGWKKTVIRQGLSLQDLFGSHFVPRPEQKSFIVSVTKPGIYILEASTGSGKTEAALAAIYNLIAAGHHDGFYFALPTRVTSQRIFERVQKFLENAFEKGMAPKLIHGQSLISDVPVGSGELAPGGMWFTANRRALLLPFGIGTIDQILMSVLHARYNFVRTLGLANKVIVIDELHSYDVYTGKLTDLLVSKLRELNCTVIILSATLTYERKQQLLGQYTSSDERYPLITTKTGHRAYTRSAGKGSTRSVKVCKIRENFPKLFKEVERRVLAGQQVLWILNTVDRATAVYEHMRSIPALVGLIHSRFPAIDRNPLEEQWMERLGKNGDRSQGSLLIATQVLEQSIDVDADFLITDLAPSDFIIQRIGRLFRHERSLRACSEAVAWIVCPDLGGIKSREDLKDALGVHAKIYSDYVLWRTYRVWKRRAVIHIPDDLRDILENTYRDAIPQDPVWIQEAWDNLEGKRMAMRQTAHMSTGSFVRVNDEDDLIPVDVSEEDSGSPMTRIMSVPTSQLLLCSAMTEYTDTVDFDFMDGGTYTLTKNKRSIAASKEIAYRMVKVPQNKTLREAVSPDWLNCVVFGNQIPVIVGTDTRVRLLDGTDTGYLYKRDCGVYKPKTL